jgi:hypothetical protein
VIVRISRTSLGPHATTGILTMDHMGFRLFTLEDAWRDNRSGVSCVPAGHYKLERHESEKYGKTWAMVNPDLGVYHWPQPEGKGRFACLCVHSGNWDDDVEGCVIVGERAGDGFDPKSKRVEPRLFESRDAVKVFKDALPWEDHELIISDPS